MKGYYKVVTLIDPPLMMYDDQKYNHDTNTCERGYMLCSIPIQSGDNDAGSSLKNNDNNLTAMINNTRNSCCYGYMVDLLLHFKEKTKFNFNLKVSKEGVFGVFIPEKNTFNGLIGDVLNGEASLVLQALGLTMERANYVDFTIPFLRSDVSFYLPEVLPQYNYLTFSFIAHIDANVIFVGILAYLTVTFLLFIIDNTTAYLKERSTTKDKDGGRGKLITRRNKTKTTKQKLFSHYFFNDCFLYIGGLVFQRGIGGKAPQTFSGKCVAQCFAFAMVIGTTIYTATLTAHAVSNLEKNKFLGLKDPKVREIILSLLMK